MFNLLPEQQKKSLNREYLFRKIYVVCLCLLFSVVVGFIFLLPSYISAHIDLTEAKNHQAQIQKSVAAVQTVSSDDLAKANTEIGLLAGASSTPLSTYLLQIVAAEPSTIRLSAISFNAGNRSNLASFNISGVGSNRQSLIVFSDNLKKISDFVSVNLPIDTLAPEKNGQFTIVATVK